MPNLDHEEFVVRTVLRCRLSAIVAMGGAVRHRPRRPGGGA